MAGLARNRAGLMLRGEKQFFIQSRLSALARREAFASVAVLIQRLRTLGDDALSQAAVEALAAPETSFFRDRTPFEHLADDILPELAAVRPQGEVRIWCAGCSTGQEAYSLAILLHQALPDLPDWQVTITATDINRQFLNKAVAGIYGEWSFRNAPEGLKELVQTIADRMTAK